MSTPTLELTEDAMADLTKVMLSMHASYGEINAVCDKVKKGDVASGVLLDIVSKIARNTSLFNAFVAEYKKNESVEDIDESKEGIQAAAEMKSALNKVAANLNLTKLEISIVLNDLIKVNTPTADFIKTLVRHAAANPSLLKQESMNTEDNATLTIVKGLTEAVKMTNGVRWDLAPEKDRLKGEYYVTYDDRTKKMVAYGLTLKGADRIAATDKVNLKSASANHFADNVMKKGVTESVLTEENSAKLFNDIASLKRIGWNLDRITKHLITSKEYGIQMTSDMIKNIFSPSLTKGTSSPMKKPAKDKAPSGWGMRKKVSWPKDPPKSRLNDPQHAEGYIGQVIDSGESQDITGSEMYSILDQAGYTRPTIMWVVRNFGMEGDLTKSQLAATANSPTSKNPESAAARKFALRKAHNALSTN